MSEHTIAATDASFDSEVIHAQVPVLVDFWGEWCGPCKAMAPALEQVAQDYAGRAKVVKVEMDKNQKTAVAWRVRSAPTLLLFNHGTLQATHVGMASRAELARMFDSML